MVTKNPIKDFLYIPAYIKVMKYLYVNSKCNSMYKLSKELDITFNHIFHLTNFLNDNKLILKNKTGRNNIITLTPKGLVLGKICYELIEVLKNERKNKI